MIIFFSNHFMLILFLFYPQSLTVTSSTPSVQIEGINFNRLIKTKKEFKNLKYQEIQDIFTEVNQIKLVFNMIWVIEILNIQQKERLLIKFSGIKHLKLIKIQNRMGIEVVLILRFRNSLMKSLRVVSGIKNEIKKDQ